jgi:MFS family permease
VFAKDVLHVDSRGLGILASAAGMGALTGLLSYPWVQLRITPRNLIVAALTGYGTCLIGLALSPWFWFSFSMVFIAGLTHSYFMTSVQVTLQTLVDDHYRGRVMGVFTLVWSLVFLSGFLLNFAGSLTGPQVALAGGASITLVFVWSSLARSSALKELRLTPRAK